MATLHWNTPNGTTGSLDLSKISLDDGTFTLHAKNAAYDYILFGDVSSDNRGRLWWSGTFIRSGSTHGAAIGPDSDNGAVIFPWLQDLSLTNQSCTRVYGSNTYDTCASVIVHGIDHPTNPGKFILYAKTASDSYALVGNPEDGTLYWNSSPVLTTQSNLAASKITGAVPIAHGGTGATTRLDAAKNLLNENVGTNATYFLTMTNSFANMGYSSVANVKSVLGINAGTAALLNAGTDTTNRVWTAKILSAFVESKCTPGKSIAANGYVKLDSGLIIQWGVMTQSSDNVAHTFPISFASACYGVFTQIANPSVNSYFGTNTADNFYPVNISKTGFNMYAKSGERQGKIYYLAFGK